MRTLLAALAMFLIFGVTLLCARIIERRAVSLRSQHGVHCDCDACEEEHAQ